MKYVVRIGDRTFDVDVNGNRIRIGTGGEQPARLVPMPWGPLRRLELGGRSRTYAVVRSGDAWKLYHGGVVWEAEVVDERANTLRRLVGRSTVTHAADGAVRAPMPGLVLRVEVTEGQSVSAGTGLVVLEAMKMENEIRAPAAGTVRKVLVTQGQAVEKGTPLIELSGQG